ASLPVGFRLRRVGPSYSPGSAGLGNAGWALNRQPVLIHDHGFRSGAASIAVPYGIYDLLAQ
ncbi:hypothetical protein ACFL5O_04725, partial [Myxococcota bacterium]